MSLQPPVYRQAALEKYRSPQALNDMPQLLPLSTRVMLAAVLILVAALLLWGFGGKLIIRIEAQGVFQADMLLVPLDSGQAAQVRVGMPVYAACSGMPFTGTVQTMTYDPLQERFELAVRLETSPVQSAPCSVSVITRQERPIERVFPIPR